MRADGKRNEGGRNIQKQLYEGQCTVSCYNCVCVCMCVCVCVCVQAAELYRVIEEQNKMLCSLKELANRNQLQQLQVCLHICDPQNIFVIYNTALIYNEIYNTIVRINRCSSSSVWSLTTILNHFSFVSPFCPSVFVRLSFSPLCRRPVLRVSEVRVRFWLCRRLSSRLSWSCRPISGPSSRRPGRRRT